MPKALLSLWFFLSLALAQDYTVSITFDGGGWFDRSFNQATWTGVTKAVRALSQDHPIEVLIYDGTPDTSAAGQASLAAAGVDLMVAAGFLQADAIEVVSSQFPETAFVLIDAVVEEDNVQSILFKEHEGSFLVGYLAGIMTQTGTVAFIGGMDVPLIRAFDLGYQEGVKAACSECVVVSSYVGTTPEAFNNPSVAQTLAEQAVIAGADILFAAAGASGQGVIAYVNTTMCYDARPLSLRQTPLTLTTLLAKSEAYRAACLGRQPLFFIGVDSNQNYLGDNDDDPTTLNHGLTSMLKRVDVAAFNAVTDLVNGRFRGGIQTLGLAEDGVGYAVDQFNQALIPEEVISRLEAIKAQIISKELIVPDYRMLR